MLIASGGGSSAPHGLLHNLRPEPRVRHTAPGYATYCERAGSRVIPVVVLEPTSA